jgi:DNA primase
MGTALTEQQLRELSRLTRRLYLCFDADAAGEAAALRGMELAVRRDLDVRVVPLPPGLDPAEAPDGFEERLDDAVPFPLYRVKLIVDEPQDRQAAHREAKAFLDGLGDSPERHDAWRYVNDKLGMTVQLQSAVYTMKAAPVSQRVLDAGDRLERDLLAACLAFPSLREALRQIPDDHFDSELHRRLRAVILGEREDEEVVPALAELDALAASEAIDEATAKELLLRLRERFLRRRLADASLEETKELQRKLLEIREAVQSIA